MIEINKEFKEKLFELKITNRLDKITRFFNNKEENICSRMCGIDECFGIPNKGKFSEDKIESFRDYIDKYVDEQNSGNHSYYENELKRMIENPTEPPSDCPYWDLIKNIDNILPLLNMMNSNDIFIENSEDNDNEDK